MLGAVKISWGPDKQGAHFFKLRHLISILTDVIVTGK
jgi:hypothetical protein